MRTILAIITLPLSLLEVLALASIADLEDCAGRTPRR